MVSHHCCCFQPRPLNPQGSLQARRALSEKQWCQRQLCSFHFNYHDVIAQHRPFSPFRGHFCPAVLHISQPSVIPAIRGGTARLSGSTAPTDPVHQAALLSRQQLSSAEERGVCYPHTHTHTPTSESRQICPASPPPTLSLFNLLLQAD